METRTIKVLSLWVLLGCAGVGTYYLSNRIESQVGAAAVFLAGGKSHEVALYSGKAVPAEVSARAGEEIAFIVKDKSIHDISEERSQRRDARLESGEIGKDESYSLVFQAPGTYYFYDRMDQDIRVSISIK